MEKQSHSDPPVIHILASAAVLNLCANGVLAAGGSPLLSRNIREFPSIRSQALLLNTGMWEQSSSRIFTYACSLAVKRGIPVILDPVGAGFSPVRRRFTAQLIRKYPQKIFIKSNPSEMEAIAEDSVLCRGVDSTGSVDRALLAAAKLEKYISGWMITGTIDYTGSEGRMTSISGGHPGMSGICGTGCLLGAITALELSRSSDVISGASRASSICKSAGEYASQNSAGPGTFQSHFLDGIYLRSGEAL